MSHALMLHLPDDLYESLRRNAQASNQPLEAMLLRTLHVSLPSLDGLPADLADELIRLEALDDDGLRAIVHETVADADQDTIEGLLENRAGTLSDSDRKRIDELLERVNRTTLRKARAAVLLRFRGRQVPTVADLRERLALGE